LKRRSGWRSIFSDGLLLVSERASSALSIPVALRAGLAFELLGVDSESSWDRSRPLLVFLTAVLAFLGAARASFSSFSSAARSASLSAFLRAASCFLASASSL